jgi:hypothetical protein
MLNFGVRSRFSTSSGPENTSLLVIAESACVWCHSKADFEMPAVGIEWFGPQSLVGEVVSALDRKGACHDHRV